MSPVTSKENSLSIASEKPKIPFQVPAKIVDLTNDTPFENKWRPIVPFTKKAPLAKRNKDAIYNYVYDIRPVITGLF